MVCKKCGCENNGGSIFCKMCGNRIDGKRICPKCNFENEEDDVFCGNCGTRIDGKKFCKNCGNEVDGVFCTKCGLKYGETKIKKSNSSEDGFVIVKPVNKILDLVGNSVLMLGAFLSLIFIFFAGFKMSDTEEYTIFYFFGKAYDNLKLQYPGVGSYSASLEISSYLPTILSTVVIVASIVCCVLFFILAIVTFIKKVCFNGVKSPALYTLLNIISYIVCVISLKSIFHLQVGYYDGLTSEVISAVNLNSISEIGIIINIIVVSIYYAISVVNNALNLKKNKIANFVFSTLSSVVLVIIAILLSNMFLTTNVAEENAKIVSSFTMTSTIISSLSKEIDMVDAVILGGLTQGLFIVALFIVMLTIAKLITGSKKDLTYSIWSTSLVVVSVVMGFVTMGLYLKYIAQYIIEVAGTDLIEEIVSMNCTGMIVAGVLSLISLTLVIINNVLKNKANYIKY